MKKLLCKTAAICLAAAILLCGCTESKIEENAVLDAAVTAARAQKNLFGAEESENLLSLTENFSAGVSLCDWTAISFKELGISDDYDFYLESLEAYVTEKYASEGKLDSSKATEWHRIIMTATALGADATAFGTNPDGTKINLVADGIYNYVNGDLGAQGINGYIYALLALDCGKYEVPKNSRYTRESIVAAIIAEQHEDGSFGFGKRSDIDITAMALHALAPYTDDRSIKAVLDAGIEFLSNEQNGDGTFSGIDEKTSESTSQVIIALCANGIDPRTDERFIRHKTSVYDALFDFRQKDGSFSHRIDEEKGDILATNQAMAAFLALANFENGKSGAFIFYD